MFSILANRNKGDSVANFRLSIKLFFHTSMFVFYNSFNIWLYNFIYYTKIGEELSKNYDIHNLFNYGPCFATEWNFIIQSIYLTLSLCHDFLEWFDKHEGELGKKIRYWRDVVFCGLVVPITAFVTSMFWIVYAIDRELVFPKVYDEIVPWWFNHCVHTNISVVMLIEMLLEPRRRPTDFKLETIGYATISVLYAVVFYSIYFFANRWLYKVFSVMTWWQICLYQIAIWGSTHVFYRIQFPIARLIHGPETENTETNKAVTINAENVHKNENVEKKGNISNGVSVEEKNGVENGIGRVKPVIRNGVLKDQTQLNSAPFTDKSWSLKYRSVRNQFENGTL